MDIWTGIVLPAAGSAAIAVGGAFGAGLIVEVKRFIAARHLQTQVATGINALKAIAQAAGVTPAQAEGYAAKGLAAWLDGHGLKVSAQALTNAAKDVEDAVLADLKQQPAAK